MTKIKTQITQCFLIQLLDEDGDEIDCEYFFGTEEEAKERAKEFKNEVKLNDNL